MPRLRSRFGLFLTLLVAGLLALPVTWMAVTRAHARPHTQQSVSGVTFTIASINLAKATDIALIGGEIEANPFLRNSDVLVLQEVVRATDGHPSVAELLANRLRRNVVFASPDGATTFGGLAVLSDGPLRDSRTVRLKNNNLVFRSRSRIALAATADTIVGPVRIVTAHLDTRINPGARVEQLTPALEEAQGFRGPGIIAGDLNTNDMQWVSNIVPVPWPGWQASRVRTLMESRGFNTPFVSRKATFDHLGMQLDWIFSSKLTAVGYGIEPLEFSDHHAIWAQFASGSRGSSAAQ